MSDTELRLVRNGLYRNPVGAEFLLIEPLTSGVLRKYGIAHLATTTGGIWIAENRDLFGGALHLVTREGLTACGYSLISEPAGGAE